MKMITLPIEMADEKLAFSREHEMPVYKHQQIGTRWVDFVSVELKAVI